MLCFSSWNEWLQLPIKLSSLPRSAVLALTIWDIEGTFKAVPVGGTSIRLYSKRGSVSHRQWRFSCACKAGVCVCVCVFVCVCVRERERESVCVCVCTCV